MSNAFLNELPRYYSDIREFVELSKVVTKEWGSIDQATELVTQEQFIITSSEVGIARREKDYGIKADPTSESLLFRKQRLLARMAERNPLVFKRFKEAIALLLEGHKFKANLDTEKFELELILFDQSFSKFAEIHELTERFVPLNIAVRFVASLKERVSKVANFSVGEGISVSPIILRSIRITKPASLKLAGLIGEIIQIYPYELTNLDIPTTFQENTIQGKGAENSTLFPRMVGKVDVTISSSYSSTILVAEYVTVKPN